MSDLANAGDPIMRGCNISPRSEGASEASFPDSRRKGDFPMATFPVVDVPSGHSFCCPTLPDDTGRDEGEESARSTGDTGASPDCRSGNKAKRRKELPQENSTNFHTNNIRRRVGTVEATTIRRLAFEESNTTTAPDQP